MRERKRMRGTGQSSLPLVLLLTSNLKRTVVNKTSLPRVKILNDIYMLENCYILY